MQCKAATNYTYIWSGKIFLECISFFDIEEAGGATYKVLQIS